MAAAAAAQTPNTTSKSNGPRRRKLIGQRRRLEDDEGGEDEAGHGAVDLVDDDSLSEGSVASDDNDAAGDSDTSNIDDASPTSPVARKGSGGQGQKGAAHGNGTAKSGPKQPADGARVSASAGTAADVTEAEAKMGELSISDKTASAGPQEAATSTNETNGDGSSSAPAPLPQPVKASQPAVVSAASAQGPRRETAYERQRREHDLYKQKRDEDPSFVPNRGAFFMHDHRGAGPSANGFRPFGRPGRGRGRGGFAGGPFSPLHHQMHNPADPTINGPWAHDMHEAVAGSGGGRMPVARRSNYDNASQHGGSQAAASTAAIPTCPPSAVPINRSMSVEKPLGTVTVRVFFPPMKTPALFEKFTLVQYTKLPDHRPPLRRDKAVIIDLPGHPKRQIFPAIDRSFIFIPRALRPNQQRLRGNRTRSVMGSISGFSRRTSMFGGSYYNGSIYTPSVALSRRSSIVAADMTGRDFIISPTGSAISRPPMAPDNASRPVVRLPPPPTMLPPNPAGSAMMPHPGMAMPGGLMPPPTFAQAAAPPNSHPGPRPPVSAQYPQPPPHTQGSPSVNIVPPPENQSLPPKPPIPQNRPSNNLPMHQPRPQKTVSIKTIEPQPGGGYGPSPQQQPYSMPFHQQVPIQMASGFPPPGEGHSRHPSYPSHTTGTPLSQIPERAIHAAPFQPTQMPQGPPFSQPNPSTPSGPGFYGAPNAYPMMQPPPPQQGYYYPTPPAYPATMATSAGAPSFVPSGTPQGPGSAYGQPGPGETAGTPVNGRQVVPGHNLVAQEVNGMVYYYDPAQVANVPSYPSFTPAPPPTQGGGYMPGMVAPNPAEGFYYAPQPGVMYYPQ